MCTRAHPYRARVCADGTALNDLEYGIFTICAPTVVPTQQGNMWAVDIAIGDAVLMSIHAPMDTDDADDRAVDAAKEWLADSLLLALEALDPEQHRKKRAQVTFEKSWLEAKGRLKS